MIELLVLALTLGFVHTFLGPDHYVPFIVISRARKWSLKKTMWVTFIGGVGHILGSVVLGFVGVAIGLSITRIETIESFRGDIAAWLLMIFGVAYSIYDIFKLFGNGAHSHLPTFLLPKSIRPYRHLPISEEEAQEEKETNITPWILFLIFVFGPCEVLIPQLIYPAAKHDFFGVAAIATVFGLATVGTMLLTVWLGYKGISLFRLKKGEKLFHLIAGLIILFMGLGILFLGF